jgi:hypothetical protein
LPPIPVAGPQFRLYLTDSPRVFVEGNVYGMYLFRLRHRSDRLGIHLTGEGCHRRNGVFFLEERG